MKQFISFIRKEFFHIFRDRRTMLILLGMPIVQIILFGFAITTEVKNVRVAVLDPSNDVVTRRIIDRMDASEYFTVIRRFNEQTKMEMEKWEMNSTPYPQLIGPCYELFRKWNYEMDGGLEPSVMKTFYKVRKLMFQSYEEKCNPYRHPMKYRAVVWSCPAHYLSLIHI